MPHRFEGKVAIVTGGARGMGEQIVRLLVREGCAVMIADVLEGPGQALADELGDRAVYACVDVASEADWEDAVATVEITFGGLDVLVNNAAIYRRQSLENETVAEIDKVMAVNLHGPFLGIKAVATAMRERGGGSIVNVSSLAGSTCHRAGAVGHPGERRPPREYPYRDVAHDSVRRNADWPETSGRPQRNRQRGGLSRLG